MIKRNVLCVLFLAWGIGLLPGQACAGNTITWMEAVAPPFFIHEGPFKGQGYEDVVTAILQEQLTEYEHMQTTANMARHFHEFKAGKEVCNVGLYKTPEREAFLYYSVPSFFTLPTVLAIRSDRFDRFGGTKTVSLAQILKRGDLVIAHVDKRSYGKHVDDVLAEYGDARNLFVYEATELSTTFFKMLGSERIDALIGLPEEVVYQAEKQGIRDKIMTLTIAENQVSYESWFSHVACSKTAWGKQVIERVNEVLLQVRSSERYRQAYERWLDESSLEGYRTLYQEVFVNSR